MSSYYFLQRTSFQGRVIGPSLFQRAQMINQPKEVRLLVVDVTVFYLNKEFKKITTATGTSLNKSFNEQNNGCARALYIFVNFFASFAKQQHGITKLSIFPINAGYVISAELQIKMRVGQLTPSTLDPLCLCRVLHEKCVQLPCLKPGLQQEFNLLMAGFETVTIWCSPYCSCHNCTVNPLC